MTENNTVVVIGGGYAGVLAANRLRKRPGMNIAVVNPRPRFVERIRLHQLIAGSDDATEGYDELLGADIKLFVDSATRINAADRIVELASGQTLSYDYLIYAVGSTGSVPAGVPGAAEFAYPLSELEQAQRLRARLADVPLAAPVVVVGGGLTGVEVAAELAETGRSVTLVGDILAPTLADSGRRSVGKRLAKLGVTVVTGPDAVVHRVGVDTVELAGGRMLPSVVTVWTAGFGVPGLAAASGLSVDHIGRIRTDETLTSIDDDRIVAAGDAATPSDLPLRMSCQAALPMGAQAAETILARLDGVPPAPVRQAFAGQCISVGRGAGTIQLAHTDDRPRRVFIGGKAAAFVKEQVCRGTVNFLRKEAAKPGSYFWLKSDFRQALLADSPEPVVSR